MSEDFYDVLGVDRNAGEDEINRAFRKKAAKYHPDVSDDPDAEEKFKRIQKAKEVLTDEEKRAAYDQMGHDRFEQAAKHGGFDGAGAAGGDPFAGGSPFGDFGDIFEQFFGGSSRGRRQNGPRQGRDLRTSMEIDLEEAYDGVTKQITLERPETCEECGGEGHPPDATVRRCPECDGRGQVTRIQQSALGRIQQTQTCRRCGGTGETTSERCSACRGDGIVTGKATLSVDIPAGIRNGETLRLSGEGAPGENGGPKGNLLIEIAIRDHPDFTREGDDLHYQQPVSFPQAVFGDTVEIPTLSDPVEVDIPAGTQSGETITVRGAGMPRRRRRSDGDLHVQVHVVTPERLSTEEKEALEAFAAAGGEEIDVDRGLFDRLRGSI